jgi:arylformamidase
MNTKRIIDLSHQLNAGEEEYKLEIRTYSVDEKFPQYKREKNDWYIMQELSMSTHVGTHIESPYHAYRKGLDIAGISLDRLVGECILMDFSFKKPGEEISLEEIKKYDSKIKESDIVFIYTGRDKYYHDIKQSHERPYPTTEAVKWIVGRNISCIGIDCTGIEVKGSKDQPNHQVLFRSNIPLVENLTNLDKIKKERFNVFILPLNIKKLESCPVRVIAILE